MEYSLNDLFKKQAKLEKKQNTIENAIALVNQKIKTAEDKQQVNIASQAMEPSNENKERVNKQEVKIEHLYEDRQALQIKLKEVKMDLENLEFKLSDVGPEASR